MVEWLNGYVVKSVTRIVRYGMQWEHHHSTINPLNHSTT